MDNLLAGTLFSLIRGVSMPGYCPATLPHPAVHLWRTFRFKPNAIP
jgi:hypothetical protein